MSDFIEKIEFQKGKEGKENLFPPFKGGDKIFLGGQKEVENLIKFYLKGKENKFLYEEFEKKWKKFKNNKNYSKENLFNIYYFVQSKKNAKRFKINCVLGNNGGGKSTLLRGINDKLNDKDIKQITIDNNNNNNNNNNKYSFYDNISIFDYTKVNINNKSKTKITEKSKNNEEIINLMEFTNSTYNISILGRFLKYVCIYSYVLNKYEYKKDFLEDFLGFSLKEKNIWKFGYGDENYNLFEIIEEYFRENNEKYLNDFINNKIEYTSKDNKKISFGDEIKKIINLSSGQKVILLRFSFYLTYILFSYEEYKEKLKKENKKLEDNPFETVILIDEPDLHLHLDWQKKYIQKLIDVFSTLDKNIKLHFIIATHSPFIISDLPTESIVVLDGKDGSTKIKTYNGTDINDEKKNGMKFEKYSDVLKFERNNNLKKKTFGANFIDIIRDGFFFEDEILMGSFAENVIHQVAESERRKIFLASLKFQLEYKKHEKENIQGQIKEINLFELEEVFEKLKDETKDILEPILKLILEDGFKKYDKKEDILEEIKSNYKNIKNLKDETKDILEPILKLILEDGFKKYDKKEDILEEIKSNYKNIKNLKNNWIKVKNEKIDEEINKIDEEINKIKKDIKSINEEIKGYENNIQENIGDDFLRDNLLYFKGKNND